MTNLEQFKKGRLFNFILNTFIGVITWKRGFAHSVEKIRIKSGWVINLISIADEFSLLRAVIGKIRPNSQSDHIFTIPQAGFQGNGLGFFCHP
jgi:hypothetical protein